MVGFKRIQLSPTKEGLDNITFLTLTTKRYIASDSSILFNCRRTPARPSAANNMSKLSSPSKLRYPVYTRLYNTSASSKRFCPASIGARATILLNDQDQEYQYQWYQSRPLQAFPGFRHRGSDQSNQCKYPYDILHQYNDTVLFLPCTKSMPRLFLSPTSVDVPLNI